MARHKQNEIEVKLVNKGGRPKKFTDIEELEMKIEAYFDHCDNFTRNMFVPKLGFTVEVPAPKPYTISGLAVWLETTRDLLLEYEKNPKEPRFADTIKKAKQKIQSYAEESLWRPQIAAGVIFNLKNNWGWKDSTEQKIITDPIDLSSLSNEEIKQLADINSKINADKQ